MELGPNVTVLSRGDRRFYLVGTAHISERSVREVRETIEAVKPDTVCIELCPSRYEAMIDESRWEKLDIFQVIRQKKVLFVLAQLTLSSYQKRLGDKLGVQPGAEQMEAVHAAEEIGAELVLADRDIQATLKRTWRTLRLSEKIKVLGALGGGFFDREEITEEQLEALKDRDTITEMMQAFAEQMPGVQRPLIDERDQYLMAKVEASPGQSVVAVVGAGHVAGMQRYFGQEVDLDALTVIPPPKRWVEWLKWIIPALMIAAFAFGYSKADGQSFQQMLLSWIVPNALMAALMTLVAGGKLLSVLTAAIASPITSLNPTIGTGMVVGLMEAWLRRPTIKDCQRIPEDSTSLRGFYRNPFTRVLLVAVMANIGSALGAYVGVFLVAKLL